MKIMSFDIKQLENFLVAAKYLNFTKAAESLYITQSALSKQIASLEAAVGTPLFIRRNNVIKLTNAGKLLFREGIALMEHIKEIEELMQDAAKGTVGTLNIAVQDTFLGVVPNVFEEFKKEHPNITFVARFYPPEKLPELILAGEVDVGTLHSFDLAGEYGADKFGRLRMYKENYSIVVPPHHPLAKRKSVKLSEIKDENVLELPQLSQPPAISELINRTYERRRKKGDTYPIPVDFDDLMLQVKMGLGITTLVSAIAHGSPRGCPVVDIEDAETEVDVLLIWKRDNQNPSLPLFINLIRDLLPDSILE